MNWQKASGYNKRSKVEAAMSRYKRVIGETLKSRDDARRETEVAIAVKSLNRMRDFGRAIAPVLRKQPRAGANARFAISMQQSLVSTSKSFFGNMYQPSKCPHIFGAVSSQYARIGV
jgi:hypothetical protein